MYVPLFFRSFLYKRCHLDHLLQSQTILSVLYKIRNFLVEEGSPILVEDTDEDQHWHTFHSSIDNVEPLAKRVCIFCKNELRIKDMKTPNILVYQPGRKQMGGTINIIIKLISYIRLSFLQLKIKGYQKHEKRMHLGLSL